MYADQRYVPSGSRSLSLGAALAINGLVLAGLISFLPNVIPKPPVTVLTGTNIPIDPPPPPEPVKTEKVKTETPPQQTEIYMPVPPIPLDSQPKMAGTDVPPIGPPPTGPVDNPGPVTIEQPPAPLPPLIGAQRDPRYARDFQPEYPAQELRAQRDGIVAIRVLIGADGRVKAVEQVSATSAAFFDATKRQALSKWRFKPANRGGVPQESWKTMNVRFELKNA